MNTFGNARSTASKTAIREAMLELLGEKNINKISVQDIVTRAGVNRSTFYAHYQDIGDLMEKIEEDMAGPLSSEMYADGATADTIFGLTELSRMVAYFRENRIFYATFFLTSSESRIVQESAHLMRHRFIEPQLQKANQFTKEEYDFQFEFCTSGFFGVICKWLDGNCAEPDVVVAGALNKLFMKCLG